MREGTGRYKIKDLDFAATARLEKDEKRDEDELTRSGITGEELRSDTRKFRENVAGQRTTPFSHGFLALFASPLRGFHRDVSEWQMLRLYISATACLRRINI